MPIQVIDNQRLYRQIAAQLSALIASGEFAEGCRLPSERDLALQLRVSRPSVREALIALEIEGKVDVRAGAGIFVARRRPAAAADPAEAGPFEPLRARRLIEGEIAMEAARRAKAEDLSAIRRAVAEMDRRHRQDVDADAIDREFHIGIARAAHNGSLVSIVGSLWDQGRGEIWRRMEPHFRTPSMRAAALRDHRAILDALEARDARGARAAMHRHLDRVDQEVSRGREPSKERASAKPAEKVGRDGAKASAATGGGPVHELQGVGRVGRDGAKASAATGGPRPRGSGRR